MAIHNIIQLHKKNLIIEAITATRQTQLMWPKKKNEKQKVLKYLHQTQRQYLVIVGR